MTTRAWSATYDMNNDANFRAWGVSTSSGFSFVGLVQTSDTGQINWATVSKGFTTNTSLGYEIWRFTDSSIFLKIEYGTGQTSFHAQMWATVGTGSDGAGNLTGTQSTRRIVGSTQILNPTAFTNYAVYTQSKGFIAFAGLRFSNRFPIFFAVAKTTNANGVPNAVGYTFYNASDATSPATVQAVNLQTNTTFTSDGTGRYSFLPHNIATTTTAASDLQAFMHWTAMRQVFPVPQMMTVLNSEFPVGTSFSTIPIGTSSWNYISLGYNTANGEVSSGGRETAIAILWE